METATVNSFEGRGGYGNAVTPSTQWSSNQGMPQDLVSNFGNTQGFNSQTGCPNYNQERVHLCQERANEAEASLHKYREITQNLQQQNNRLAEIIWASKAQYDTLKQRTDYYETSTASRRLVELGSENKQIKEQLASLQYENAQLKKENQRLMFSQGKYKGKARPDAVVATDLLRSLGPSDTRDGTPEARTHQEVPAQLPRSISQAPHASPARIAETCSVTTSHEQGPPSAATGPSSICSDGYFEQIGANSPNEPPTASLTFDHVETPSSKFHGDTKVSPYLDPTRIDGFPTTLAHASSATTTIDLTDDSLHSADVPIVSASLTQTLLPPTQSLSSQEAENSQSQVEIRTNFSKKDLTWLQGHHPGRITSDYRTNFGSCRSSNSSSMRLPIPDASRAGSTAKRTEDDSGNESTPNEAPKKQAPKKLSTKRSTKQAAYSKKQDKVRKSNDAANPQPEQSSPISASASNGGKKGRNSAKVQKRQEQSRKSLAQNQQHITQDPLDDGMHENGSGIRPNSSANIERTPSGMPLDSLFEDEMDVDRDPATEGFDSTQRAEESKEEGETSSSQDSTKQGSEDTQDAMDETEGDCDPVFLARLEAQLAADAEEESEEE